MKEEVALLLKLQRANATTLVRIGVFLTESSYYPYIITLFVQED